MGEELDKMDILREVVDDMVFDRDYELDKEMETLIMKILTNIKRKKIIDKDNWDLEDMKIDGRLPSEWDMVKVLEFRGSKFKARLSITKIDDSKLDKDEVIEKVQKIAGDNGISESLLD